MARRKTIMIADIEKVIYAPSEMNWKGIVKTVCILPLGFKRCPKCHRKLSSYVFPIKVNEKECIKTDGMACRSCDTFYSISGKMFEALEMIRNQPGDYSLDRSINYQYDAEAASKTFSETKSAYCQVVVCNSKELRTYVIAMDRRECDRSGVVHYTSSIALKLLTALYLKRTQVLLNSDEPYLIVRERRPIHHVMSPIVEPTSSVSVIQKSGGGFFDPSANVVQMDGLVFCSASRQLQVLPISYNKTDNIYYVDRYNFRRFCETYGIPIAKYVDFSTGIVRDLNEESLLHMLGYNVGQADGLDEEERHKILADIVDSDIMKVYEIKNHLGFLIFMNKSNPRRRLAVEKWKNDKRFIETYRRNHDNFVFVQSVQGIH